MNDNKSGKVGGVTVGELVRDLQRRLGGEYGAGEARAMVRLMLHAVKGWDATAIIMHEPDAASDYLVDQTERIVERLMGGEPLQYILGEARFYGMGLRVTPAVLIPRPETAELVDKIVSENGESDLRVLDVGTGSGAIAIALARNLRFADVTAIDISTEAIEVAQENAARLHARIRFEYADVFDYHPTPGSLDIIVSNPPYIAESERSEMERNVLEHEPAQALFVPDDNPLIYYSRIAEIGREALKPGGRLYFEINPLFANDLRQMLQREGYQDVELTNDSFNRVRFASAKKL